MRFKIWASALLFFAACEFVSPSFVAAESSYPVLPVYDRLFGPETYRDLSRRDAQARQTILDESVGRLIKQADDLGIPLKRISESIIQGLTTDDGRVINFKPHVVDLRWTWISLYAPEEGALIGSRVGAERTKKWVSLFGELPDSAVYQLALEKCGKIPKFNREQIRAQINSGEISESEYNKFLSVKRYQGTPIDYISYNSCSIKAGGVDMLEIYERDRHLIYLPQLLEIQKRELPQKVAGTYVKPKYQFVPQEVSVFTERLTEAATPAQSAAPAQPSRSSVIQTIFAAIVSAGTLEFGDELFCFLKTNVGTNSNGESWRGCHDKVRLEFIRAEMSFPYIYLFMSVVTALFFNPFAWIFSSFSRDKIFSFGGSFKRFFALELAEQTIAIMGILLTYRSISEAPILIAFALGSAGVRGTFMGFLRKWEVDHQFRIIFIFFVILIVSVAAYQYA